MSKPIPAKLEAYNVTIPQMLTAIGDANINVGGREIAIGQQSVNIRGIGLIDDGGADDLTKGYHVADIENIVLSQANGVPVRIKDVAKVSVGYVPRLGIAGRDHDDDVAAAIVVMGRTQHTNDIVPRVQAEIEKINHDGTPAARREGGALLRSWLAGRRDHAHGPAQSRFRLSAGVPDPVDLSRRSAQRHHRRVNIPFALFFAIIMLVLSGEDANLLSVGAVDFGIIVDSAVILVENIFRNFQVRAATRRLLLQHLSEGIGARTRPSRHHGHTASWTNRLRLILISALQVDKAVFSPPLITVAAFVPLFTMQGVEGQIFGPMARTYAYALAGALIATFTVTPVLASLVLPEHVEEAETIVVRGLRAVYTPVLRCALDNRRARRSCRARLPGRQRLSAPPGSAANSCRRWRKAITGSARRCRRRCRSTRAPTRPARCARSCCAIPEVSRWSRSTAAPTTAATPRPSPMSNCSRR